MILSMGGKGGVGKTGVMVAVAEWFTANEIPAKLLDLDTENKARGSLTHFFGGNVPKVNIHTPAGLDAFVDHLSDGPAVILADMGAGSGQVTYDWFEKMYPVQEVFKPAVIRMDYRLADLENGARRYGVTLGDVATRKIDAPELQKASLVMRAQSYRRRIFAELERVTEVLLP